ncbi:hypothetical protein Astex_1603 [Asticcacaulis excentricus CB 48]|uniref:Uncharacterized protein n=1 Tax=Asticcacaulis excentricus (strain ATCC 15261 / DSM 4724 / KCTC 12464 / NCIMB 9791 / VKM B-1370 / CB 48) TaxID=573065 RepID=E8RQP1_ASTEC|nr:hypothetical protein Astex_1603 [Asticcacaulis excentricus CB 48]
MLKRTRFIVFECASPLTTMVLIMTLSAQALPNQRAI